MGVLTAQHGRQIIANIVLPMSYVSWLELHDISELYSNFVEPAD